MKKTSAKILALLLVLMLSLSALAVTASAAAPAFSISSKSVAVGSTVVVEVSLSANSNAGSGDFVLKYDNAKLTPTKAVAGDLLNDAGASLTRNLNYSANSIKCAFAGAEALTDGGVLAKITFEGKEAGTAALSFESTALYTLASAPITATAGTGTVTVTGGTTVKYKLTYDANGGINPPSSQTYTSAGSRTISTTKPTWTGHVFDSWNTKANGSGDSYQPGDPIMVDKEITLYAQWTTATTNYTVTYNANGGTVSPATQTVASGGKIDAFPTPTKSVKITYKPNGTGATGAPAAQTVNLTCKGWSKTATGSVVSTPYTVTSSHTLYAIWNPGSATLSATQPTRPNYEFQGWTKTSGATAKDYDAGASINDLTADLTLYAVWKKSTTPANPTASAVLNVGKSTKVDYKADVTITATATGVPSGYVVALYDGNTQIAKGDNASVSYHVGNMTANRTFTAKIVDGSGNVQKDGSGNELSKNVEVTVNTGFFAKIVAFFRGLFGSLPKVEIKP